MKYTKYILFLVALLFVACSIDDDFVTSKNASDKVQLACRILPFNEYDVVTRATVSNKENEIKSLIYAIFLEDGKCIYCKTYNSGAHTIITINRTEDFREIREALGNEDLLQNCKVKVIANYPAIIDKFEEEAAKNSAYIVENEIDLNNYIANEVVYKGGGNDDACWTETMFDEIDQELSNDDNNTAESEYSTGIIGVPSTGLPRLGESTIDLRSSAPDANTTYEVGLQSLYAKISFQIRLSATQAAPESGNYLRFRKFDVVNRPKAVDMIGGTPTPQGKGSDITGITSTNDDCDVYSTPIECKGEEIEWDVVSDKGEVDLTFYVPERFKRANYSADNYPYPFKTANGGTIRTEDLKLRQRYKPLLVKDDEITVAEGLDQTDATYVRLNTIFVNHQGHSYDVSYKIYLGNDEYSNFDIVRNHHYINVVTIRGIENSSDQSDVEGAVSIDHRVDVQRTLPAIISLRREMLLDSHFEVRPMRIRKNTNYRIPDSEDVPSGITQAVKIEVKYSDDDAAATDATKRWVGLERSFGKGNPDNTTATQNTYIHTPGSSYGKRKYFTTDLTTSALALATPVADLDDLLGDSQDEDNNGFSIKGGQAVIVPVADDDECVWIYVDECNEESEASTTPGDTRSAKLIVTNGYVTSSGDWYEYQDMDPITYTISQHLLYKVPKTGGGYYYIECEEEYLHNFDADDTFEDNKTEFEGMPWGMDTIQLSNIYSASYFVYSTEGWTSFMDELIRLYYKYILRDEESYVNFEGQLNIAMNTKGLNAKYDFYISRDVADKSSEVKSKLTVRDYSGHTFNTEIASYVKRAYSSHQGESATNKTAKIECITLAEQPTSAFAYCYNRNKRNSNGTVAEQKWYMPAIDELEDIMKNSFITFADFHGQYYWSCQPAYRIEELDFIYKEDGKVQQGEDFTGTFYVDNRLRARATMVDVDENKNFEAMISSGANIYGVYSGEVNAEMSWLGYPKTFNITIGNYDPYENPDPEENIEIQHPGNKARTVQCRVRAVRKMN